MGIIPRKLTGNILIVEEGTSILMNMQIFIVLDAVTKIISRSGHSSAQTEGMIFVFQPQLDFPLY
jgi:hypothetical protein